MKTSKIQMQSDHFFYPALAILISATGFAGFSFTYFGPIIGGTYPPSGAALHLHGWSFFFWYLLFPIQAILIPSKKGKLHKRLGLLSIILVIFMTLTGILVVSVRVEEAVRLETPGTWLEYGPLILSNLVLFVIFYIAGIYAALKNRFQSHKRFIIVASAIGLGAGFFRLILFLSGFHPLSLPIGVLSCSLFIIIGIIYDFITQKKVHSAYLIGLMVMLVVEISLLPQVNGGLVDWLNQILAYIGENLSFLYPSETSI